MRIKAGSQKNPLIVIVWIIKTPIRALSKAKEFYVKGITNFSTSYNRPMMIIEDANRNNTMESPMSFSTAVLYNNNHNQPSGGLIRASSDGSITMADIERFMMQQKQNEQLQSSLSRKGVPRSCSLGMSRIDEDRASSFRDDNIILFAKKVNIGESRLSRNLSRA